MSVRDYRERNEKLSECKEVLLNRAHGCCQKCGGRNGLRVYFESDDAKNKLDPARAVLLCDKCFDTVLSVNRILQAQKEYYSRK